MLFEMWTWMGPKNYVLDGGQDPRRRSTFDVAWRWDFLDFPTCSWALLPVALMSGISPTSVLMAQPQKQSKCHVKFSHWKIPLQYGLSSKFFDHSLLIPKADTHFNITRNMGGCIDLGTAVRVHSLCTRLYQTYHSEIWFHCRQWTCILQKKSPTVIIMDIIQQYYDRDWRTPLNSHWKLKNHFKHYYLPSKNCIVYRHGTGGSYYLTARFRTYPWMNRAATF